MKYTNSNVLRTSNFRISQLGHTDYQNILCIPMLSGLLGALALCLTLREKEMEYIQLAWEKIMIKYSNFYWIQISLLHHVKTKKNCRLNHHVRCHAYFTLPRPLFLLLLRRPSLFLRLLISSGLPLHSIHPHHSALWCTLKTMYLITLNVCFFSTKHILRRLLLNFFHQKRTWSCWGYFVCCFALLIVFQERVSL